MGGSGWNYFGNPRRTVNEALSARWTSTGNGRRQGRGKGMVVMGAVVRMWRRGVYGGGGAVREHYPTATDASGRSAISWTQAQDTAIK